MDWNYLYAIASFAVGAAAGYQGISERYNKDATSAALTSMASSICLRGDAYLLSPLQPCTPLATFRNGFCSRPSPVEPVLRSYFGQLYS